MGVLKWIVGLLAGLWSATSGLLTGGRSVVQKQKSGDNSINIQGGRDVSIASAVGKAEPDDER